MAGVNKVILIGNLGADPEVRYFDNGSVVANFNIATSESYTKNGEKITQTEWHRIELWEGLAKIAEQYLKKGNSVYVEGKLRTETWQDKDGNNRSTIKIRGLNMTLLGGKGSEGTNYSSEESTNNNSNQNSQSNIKPKPVAKTGEASFIDNGGDDDLPF